MKKLVFLMVVMALGTISFVGCKPADKPADTTPAAEGTADEGTTDTGTADEKTEETTEEKAE